MSVTELWLHAKHYTPPFAIAVAGIVLVLVSCGVIR